MPNQPPNARGSKVGKLPIMIGAIVVLALISVLFMNKLEATKAAQSINTAPSTTSAPSENSLAPPARPGRFMVQSLTPGFQN